MISVVLITHNRSSIIIQRAIESVVNQNYEDIELIIVNDSDKTFEELEAVRTVVERYQYNDKRITYIENETCKGACYSRNVGMNALRGEYVAFLDDDDEWFENKLKSQLEVLESNPHYVLAYCGCVNVFDDEDCREELVNTKYLQGNVLGDLLFENFVGGASFPLMKTDALKAVGGFDDEMPSCQDWDVWLKLAVVGEFTYVKEPLVKYHIHTGDQITKSYKKRITGFERILSKNSVEYAINKDAEVNVLVEMMYAYVLDGEKEEAFKIYKDRIRTAPINITKKMIVLLKCIRWSIYY